MFRNVGSYPHSDTGTTSKTWIFSGTAVIISNLIISLSHPSFLVRVDRSPDTQGHSYVADRASWPSGKTFVSLTAPWLYRSALCEDWNKSDTFIAQHNTSVISPVRCMFRPIFRVLSGAVRSHKT
jgi:hypothetical protein